METKVILAEVQNELTEVNFTGNQSMVYHFVKRLFDIIASALGLIILSPLFLLTAIAIKLSDGGNVIHKRYCVGRNSKIYIMYKFRSMKIDADDLEKMLTPEQIKLYKKECKLDKDPRITKVGKVIRRFSIDELPQLFSVLKGDMSIVGPRPIVEFETKYWGQDIDKVLSVKPGITGYWQTHGRSNVTYESGERQRLELLYVENQSVWLDLKILFKTFGVVLGGQGVL